MMTTIAVVFQSERGHTKALAEAVMRRGEEMDFHDGAPKAVAKEISSKDGDCRPRVGRGILCSGD